jgi:hypothetical protein
VAGEDVRIITHGVKELQKALKQMDANAPKELKAGFTNIAENVAAAIRPKIPGSGRAASSVKARGSQRGGAIAFGGSRAPHYPWLDFGGSVGRGHQQGRPWSGAIKRDWRGNPAGEGRYVYPTIREKRDYIIRETDEMMERLAKRAGFEVRN